MAYKSIESLTVKNFVIKNFRSFDDAGIYIDNLKKINLFIGKNNCGKSNVLKFVSLFSSSLKKEQFPQSLENQHRRNRQPSSISFKVGHKDIDFPFLRYINDPITFEYLINEKKLIIHNWEKLSDSELAQVSNYYGYRIPSNNYLHHTAEYFKHQIEKNLFQFFERVIYIPDFRFIKEGVNIGLTNTEINGSNIISEVFKMQNPDVGEEEKRLKFERIENTVKKLLGVENLQIQIPHTKDRMIINLEGNRLPLEYFGTGIHELVILCSALIIHNDHVVCLEEPEIHLHPDLQKKLFEFLLTTNNTYFITTHSNAFLDYSNNENVSIYHVKNKDGASQVTRCNSNRQSYEILNDLGYKASDLLQANGIIWVEGPSDRVFLKKWLSLKKPELKEGIHYSIMFYGGKLLSHFSADLEYLEEELIPLFRFNRHAYVMIDSDITTVKAKINRTKQRINSELGENHCWITKGKEIENYLTTRTLESWLKNRLNRNIKLSCTENEILDESLQNAGVDIKYSALKAQFAKEIVEHITFDDLDHYDLNKRLDQLIEFIYRWNNSNDGATIN